ncbi:MAG: hypothetical protein GYA55_07205, partial [SAR324 cluster bacterium]|nr:hypothetical protein [SAR324 cluster bacterium]
LPFPTVAAISGACLAEGFEIALACSYRILSNDAQTCVGLPHVRLGVIPAFGTLGRLPKQLGLKRALELVLEGRILKPGEAVELQLVHELVAPQALLEHAVKIALGAKKFKRPRASLHDGLLNRWGYLRKRLEAQTSARIKEHANGCLEASRVAMESMFSSHEKHGVLHLDRDAKEFGRLALANESKALLRIAQLKDSAKKLGSIAHKDVEHVNAVVLGAGNTGASIAAALVASECGLILKDNKDSQLKRALHQIKKHVASIAGLNEAEKSFLLNRIEATTRDSANFGNTNFAIEAVQEDKTVKIIALNELCESIPEESIIATSTSSFTISSFTSSLKRPSRVIGMRFFFPAETHELVEIVMGEHSSDRAIAIASALACKMGKCPVIVHDKPGALVDRIMNPYFREAFLLLQEGYSISDIDHCMQQFGFVMGPFRHLDVEGLDTAALWMDAIDIDEGTQASNLNYPKQLTALGRKGLKSGHGFYEYGRLGLRPSSDIREALHLDGAEHPIGKEQKTITERLLLSLLNQAL